MRSKPDGLLKRLSLDKIFLILPVAPWPAGWHEQICVSIEEWSMCFSAEASFGMSAVLLPAGAYCVQSAPVKNRTLLCLAVIPVIFGIQQLAEGLVWLGLAHEDAELTHRASVVFLAFAFAIWPFWIPLCGFLLEPRGIRKWLLGSFAVIGLLGGLTLFLEPALNPELLVTRQVHHSIAYEIRRSPAFPQLPIPVRH